MKLGGGVMSSYSSSSSPSENSSELYTIKFKSARMELDLSISGLDPVPLSKIGTHLLASLGSKGKNGHSLAGVPKLMWIDECARVGGITVRLRGMGTALMGTILTFAS